MLAAEQLTAAKDAAIACIWTHTALRVRPLGAYLLTLPEAEKEAGYAALLKEVAKTVGGLHRAFRDCSDRLTQEVHDSLIASNRHHKPVEIAGQRFATYHKAALEMTRQAANILVAACYKTPLTAPPAYTVNNAAHEAVFSLFRDAGYELALDLSAWKDAVGALPPDQRYPYLDRVVEIATEEIPHLDPPEFEAWIQNEWANAVPENDEEVAGYVSANDLARKYGLPAGALRGRLDRFRRDNADGWMEVEPSERGPNDPKYLYQHAAVRPIVEKMRKSPAH